MTNALDSHVREFGIISRLQLLVIVFKILTTFLSTVYLTCKENSFANNPEVSEPQGQRRLYRDSNIAAGKHIVCSVLAPFIFAVSTSIE